MGRAIFRFPDSGRAVGIWRSRLRPPRGVASSCRSAACSLTGLGDGPPKETLFVVPERL
jgi:hypothetical protein